MFGMEMMGNYESRKVARYTKGKLCIDTCAVSDSKQPFETAILHPNYNKNEWVIVEMYYTKKEAELGHDKWVKTMNKPNLPKQLKDVSTSEIAQIMDGFSNWRTMPKK